VSDLEFTPVEVSPGPWQTGFYDFLAADLEIRDLFKVYWGDRTSLGESQQPRPTQALDILEGLIKRFSQEHHAELEEAAIWHTAAHRISPISSQIRRSGVDVTWPVEAELQTMKGLHTAWRQLLADKN
jgi:hypothetical protein